MDANRIPHDLPEEEITSHDFLRQNLKKINWIDLKEAGLLSENEYNLITQYIGKNIHEKTNYIEEYGLDYASLFLTLAGRMHQEVHLQFILCLIDEMLYLKQDSVIYFTKLPDPYKPFISLLNRANQDTFINSKASKIISQILIVQPNQNAVADVFDWCAQQLHQKNLYDKIRALDALRILLQFDDYRLIFHADDGLNKLGQSIDFKIGAKSKQITLEIQVLYQTLCCFWLMSYNPDVAADFSNTTYIAKILDYIRTINKEKVIRIGLATLRNLLGKGDNNQQMIEYGFMRLLDVLQLRTWADEDIIEDLEVLSESIEANIVELSSFEIYKNEVESGNLDWNNPAHKSEKFWKENATKFEDDDFRLLGILLTFLRESQDANILSIALHDLGQFLKYHPRGRQIFTDFLQGKAYVMDKLNHQDPQVQRQALLCTQKLLITNWAYLSQN